MKKVRKQKQGYSAKRLWLLMVASRCALDQDVLFEKSFKQFSRNPPYFPALLFNYALPSSVGALISAFGSCVLAWPRPPLPRPRPPRPPRPGRWGFGEGSFWWLFCTDWDWELLSPPPSAPPLSPGPSLVSGTLWPCWRPPTPPPLPPPPPRPIRWFL